MRYSFKAKLALLLFWAVCASAQPWQWEQYEGTFWHPVEQAPTFELPGEFEPVTVGDFDGDGRDDLVRADPWTHASLDQNGQWISGSLGNGIDFYIEQELYAFGALDITGDGADELVVYSYDTNNGMLFAEAYELTEIDEASGEWLSWSERQAELEALDYPGFPRLSLFGDFNGNGLLDGATQALDRFHIYERQPNGNWSIIWSLSGNLLEYSIAFSVADLDRDGDDELIRVEQGIDCLCFPSLILLDSEDGFEWPDVSITDFPQILFAGDFDGDSIIEAMIHDANDEFIYLYELPPGQSSLAPQTPSIYEPSTAFVNKTFSDGESHFTTYHHQRAFNYQPMTLVRASRTLTWTDSAWLPGPASYWGGHILEGNQSDIDGDGLLDGLSRRRIGIEGDEMFDYEQTAVFLSNSGGTFITTFSENEDTTFVNPRIGDVEGDGQGELAVKITSGAPPGLYFFELSGSPDNWSLTHKPELSDGLPVNIGEFTLGDIDNDGQAELVAKIDGVWQACFRRNGQWVMYPDVLPAGIGEGMNLLDFDNDGQLDIVSQNGVWINTASSDADEYSAAVPSSISLTAYPNPFNPVTTISFVVPNAARVSLNVFDVQGRLVQTLTDEYYAAGEHVVEFDGTGLASGVYFARMTAGSFHSTYKLVLLK